MLIRRAVLPAALLLLLFAASISAVSRPAARDDAGDRLNWEQIQREAVELLVAYLKLDTTNPPGNEARAARFFADICKREGIEHKTFEHQPGRGNFWARLKGDGSARPIILLNHTDVVPHSAEFWSVGAFSAETRDGFIFGRGAQDMKSLGAAQFATLLALKRARVPLRRDVIFLATADEEAGGLEGAGWFVKHHPELLGNAEFLMTEGGGNQVDEGGAVRAVGVGVGEKTPVWLRLTATGEPGHGSVPRPDSAVNRLVAALNRLLAYSPPIQLTPVVEQAFRAQAPLAAPELRERFSNVREAVKDPEFRRWLERNPNWHALVRNTISVTMLEAGNKVNIIPPAARAEVDTRVVPGEKVERWVEEIKGVINDSSVRVETTLAFAANSSPTDTALTAAIAAVTKRRHPEAVITLPVLAGFTDSHYFREVGVVSYGFSPWVGAPREVGGGFHGNDERIGLSVYKEGVKFLYEIVAAVAAGK